MANTSVTEVYQEITISLTDLIDTQREVSIGLGEASHQSSNFLFMSRGKKETRLFPIQESEDLDT
jgi:hypothetical protein